MQASVLFPVWADDSKARASVAKGEVRVINEVHILGNTPAVSVGQFFQELQLLGSKVNEVAPYGGHVYSLVYVDGDRGMVIAQVDFVAEVIQAAVIAHGCNRTLVGPFARNLRDTVGMDGVSTSGHLNFEGSVLVGSHHHLLTIRVSHPAPAEVRYLTHESVDIFDEKCGPNTFSAY